MSKKDKLIKRLLSQPKDFTFDEAEMLLKCFSYYPDNKGKTSGSRVGFYNRELDSKISLHKPHPRKELLVCQIKQIIKELEEEGLL